MRGDHAGQSRSEFGAHRHLAFALIGEIEKLCDDLCAAFFCVELHRFEDGSIPFDETVTARHVAPAIKDVIPRGAILRQKITETRERLHGIIRGRDAALRRPILATESSRRK